jgi:NAD(P)H-hydrate epimerase
MKTLSIAQIKELYAGYTGSGELPDTGLNAEDAEQAEAGYFLTEEEDIRPLIKQRKDSAHKGNFGHALLIAGSYGMAGASVLAARACMRSGIGLLTVHAPSCNNHILQTTIPEAMVEADAHEKCFAGPTDTGRYNAVGIGPGLGKSKETEAALLHQLRTSQCPLVLDADALNLLAGNRHIWTALPKNSVLTPHPGELERLTGESKNPYERLAKARGLAKLADVHIVLKGHYSAVVTPEGNCYFNPTGNAGMATAGSGDVLTGIVLALLSQGYMGEEAAKAGAYVHGMAGDLALRKYGAISLNASDIIEFLPAAWRHISGRQTAGL